MAEREGLLVSFLQREVQAVLRAAVDAGANGGVLRSGDGLVDGRELRNRLNRAFSGEYTTPNTVVFDHPNIAALALYLVEELGEAGEVAAPQERPAPEPRSSVRREEDERIAIVGMACRFPRSSGYFCLLASA